MLLHSSVRRVICEIKNVFFFIEKIQGTTFWRIEPFTTKFCDSTPFSVYWEQKNLVFYQFLHLRASKRRKEIKIGSVLTRKQPQEAG